MAKWIVLLALAILFVLLAPRLGMLAVLLLAALVLVVVLAAAVRLSGMRR